MTKSDKIYATLRKLDYLWSKKGKTFCQAVNEITKGNLTLSDEEVLNNIKDINPDEKQEK